jgi:fructose/tagatose bisphosphate aldolase
MNYDRQLVSQIRAGLVVYTEKMNIETDNLLAHCKDVLRIYSDYCLKVLIHNNAIDAEPKDMEVYLFICFSLFLYLIINFIKFFY